MRAAENKKHVKRDPLLRQKYLLNVSNSWLIYEKSIKHMTTKQYRDWDRCPLPPSDAVRTQKTLFLRIFIVQYYNIFKKIRPSGNLKFNYLGILKTKKLRILMGIILLIFLKLKFHSKYFGLLWVNWNFILWPPCYGKINYDWKWVTFSWKPVKFVSKANFSALAIMAGVIPSGRVR